jgi:hypothetical protein
VCSLAVIAPFACAEPISESKGSSSIEPGDHVVDEPVPAVDSARQEVGDDRVDEPSRSSSPTNDGILGETGRGEMADQLDAGVRQRALEDAAT